MDLVFNVNVPYLALWTVAHMYMYMCVHRAHLTICHYYCIACPTPDCISAWILHCTTFSHSTTCDQWVTAISGPYSLTRRAHRARKHVPKYWRLTEETFFVPLFACCYGNVNYEWCVRPVFSPVTGEHMNIGLFLKPLSCDLKCITVDSYICLVITIFTHSIFILQVSF